MTRICAALLTIFILGGSARAASFLQPEEAIDHVGERAKVCGLVATATFAERTRGQPTFLNLGRPYPQHVFTALVWGADRSAFSYAPESLQGAVICVQGTISEYGGRAEIIVKQPSQITAGTRER